MWITELRGLLAVALVAGAIAFAWSRIEHREITSDVIATTTTSTTTTTTIPPTTTTTREQAVVAICERSLTFVDEAADIAPDAGPGPGARLGFEFWTDILELATPEIRTEVVAVVGYYESYLATAGPFEFKASRIIVEGDKEKFEQLITRPAPGLAESRGAIAFGCGVDVPDQPSMSADAFKQLEDRLLDPPDDDE